MFSESLLRTNFFIIKLNKNFFTIIYVSISHSDTSRLVGGSEPSSKHWHTIMR